MTVPVRKPSTASGNKAEMLSFGRVSDRGSPPGTDDGGRERRIIMNGWTLFFIVVGVTVCAAQLFTVIDWIEGNKK